MSRVGGCDRRLASGSSRRYVCVKLMEWTTPQVARFPWAWPLVVAVVVVDAAGHEWRDGDVVRLFLLVFFVWVGGRPRDARG